MNKELIKTKIRKVIAKAMDAGVSKEESKTYLQKAKQLLETYNLKYEDVKKTNLVIIHNTILCNKPKTSKSLFAGTIGQFFDCLSFISSKNVSYYGFKDDTDLSLSAYIQVRDACEISLKSFKQTVQYKALLKHTPTKSVTISYRKGFYHEAASNIYKMYKYRHKTVSNDRKHALILISKIEKVKNSFDKEKISFNQYKQKTQNVYAGVDEGAESGAKFKFQQSLY